MCPEAAAFSASSLLSTSSASYPLVSMVKKTVAIIPRTETPVKIQKTFSEPILLREAKTKQERNGKGKEKRGKNEEGVRHLRRRLLSTMSDTHFGSER